MELWIVTDNFVNRTSKEQRQCAFVSEFKPQHSDTDGSWRVLTIKAPKKKKKRVPVTGLCEQRLVIANIT